MKRILITGANSYIGVSFENYMKVNFPQDYLIDTVDMIDGAWRKKDFSVYDVVFHVAGIAHQKETKENAEIYYKVNRDLAIETANKAKKDKVQQFIFLSSMSVYGVDMGIITKETLPLPKSNYGKSKWQAEEAIFALNDDKFKVCILRPPMVYGKGCKGNFQTVVKIVNRSLVFPRVKNERSMIYIDNLSSFVKLMIDKNLSGVYFPQNKEYVKTVDIARAIADSLNKKRYFSFVFGSAVWVTRPLLKILQKAFGTLVYKDTEDFGYSYCISDTATSLKKSV